MAERIFTYLKAAAPTVNDDTGDGYFVGDMWLDETNDNIYQAIDVTAGAAVWLWLNTPLMLQGGFANIDPTDATTYYFGSKPASPTTTAQRRKIYMPRAGTITKIYLSMSLTGAGTTETSTVSLRLNHTTDTTISAVVDNSAYYEIAATVSVAVAAGDYVEIKWVTPTWATNPTGVNGDVMIVLE